MVDQDDNEHDVFVVPLNSILEVCLSAQVHDGGPRNDQQCISSRELGFVIVDGRSRPIGSN